MVSVEFAGPPPVKLTDSSNSCSVPLIDIIVVSRIVGRKSGIVIFRKIANGLAPSICAASYHDSSIFCNPER